MSDAAPKPKAIKKREYAPPAAGVELARKRYAQAEAAVRVDFSGADWAAAPRTGRGRAPRLYTAVKSLERSLAIYAVVVLGGTPKRHLAPVLSSTPRELREVCEAIETWRGAHLVDDMLERLRVAVAVDP